MRRSSKLVELSKLARATAQKDYETRKFRNFTNRNCSEARMRSFDRRCVDELLRAASGDWFAKTGSQQQADWRSTPGHSVQSVSAR